ncbi:MAG TPA: hypothetical protein VM821_04115 [Abditibacteriaceae bacterium]|nr:hypothetical protein [Abditibacteriaceae bacterium]
MKDLLESNPNMGLDELVEQMQKSQGPVISRTTMCRARSELNQENKNFEIKES